jgi:hypothetical protein
MFSRISLFAASPNFKIFHAEGFDDAIAADCLLQNLAQVAEARLAVLRGAANLATEFVDRPRDQRQQDSAAQRHFPIDAQKDSQKNDKRERFLK